MQRIFPFPLSSIVFRLQPKMQTGLSPEPQSRLMRLMRDDEASRFQRHPIAAMLERGSFQDHDKCADCDEYASQDGFYVGYFMQDDKGKHHGNHHAELVHRNNL